MILQQFDLTGRIAWITGGTHGLGMAMAQALGQAGATIIVNGNSSPAKLDQAVQSYRDQGMAVHVRCDESAASTAVGYPN
jgi:gluconate 5-dehydrogenase